MTQRTTLRSLGRHAVRVWIWAYTRLWLLLTVTWGYHLSLLKAWPHLSLMVTVEGGEDGKSLDSRTLEVGHKFKASLDYTVRLCLKIKSLLTYKNKVRLDPGIRAGSTPTIY